MASGGQAGRVFPAASDQRGSVGLTAGATIETDRLVLRRPLATDADAVFARYASDPAVTRFLGWRTHRSVGDTMIFLDCCDVEWQETGVGPYLIHSREDGQLLGSTGLRLVSGRRATTGYLLASDVWGRGYATEAVRAMRDLAVRLDLDRLQAVCHPAHGASSRVMEKCGFTREGILTAHAQFPNIAPGVAADVVSYATVFETGWRSLEI